MYDSTHRVSNLDTHEYNPYVNKFQNEFSKMRGMLARLPCNKKNHQLRF